jgi:hypothetical protein
MIVRPRYCVIWEFQPTFSPKPKGRSIIREIYILFSEIWDTLAEQGENKNQE